MNASAQPGNNQRTLAAQPAAAPHARRHAGMAIALPDATQHEGEGAGGGDGRTVVRTRLERVLLAARQMQQH